MLTVIIGSAMASTRRQRNGSSANGASICQYHVTRDDSVDAFERERRVLRDVAGDLTRRLAELGPEEVVVEATDSVEMRDEDRVASTNHAPAIRAMPAPMRQSARVSNTRKNPASTIDPGQRVLPRRSASTTTGTRSPSPIVNDPVREAPLVGPEPERQDEAQHDHREGDVFLAGERDHRRDREPTPTLLPRGPVGEQQRSDRDRIGMEELPHQPLVRRIEQQRDGERDATPARSQHIAPQEEHRDCAARLRDQLHGEQALLRPHLLGRTARSPTG